MRAAALSSTAQARTAAPAALLPRAAVRTSTVAASAPVAPVALRALTAATTTTAAAQSSGPLGLVISAAKVAARSVCNAGW